MTKKILMVVGLALVMAYFLAVAGVRPALAGYGHKDKVTICHKPGTPAEQTKEVPKEAVEGHLGHGDYLGECKEETTTDTTTTDQTTTTETETTTEETTTDETTTEETVTTPEVPFVCPNPDVEPIHGKDTDIDGQNDSCNPCYEPIDYENCPKLIIDVPVVTTPETPSVPEETTAVEEPEEDKPSDPNTSAPPVKVTEETLEEELDEQAEENGAVLGGGDTAGAQNSDELPNTGLPLLPIAALGAGLAGAGLRLRKRR